MNFLIDLLLTIHIVVSLLLVGVVLLQRPRSEGLGTAFASGMVEQYIGPATSALVRFTTWMAGAFFFLTVVLAVLYAHQNNGKSLIAAKLSAAAGAKAGSPTPAPITSGPVAPVIIPVAPTATPESSAVPTASPAAVLAPVPVEIPAATVVPMPTATATPSPTSTPVPIPTAAPTVPAAPALPPATPAATPEPSATVAPTPAPAARGDPGECDAGRYARAGGSHAHFRAGGRDHGTSDGSEHRADGRRCTDPDGQSRRDSERHPGSGTRAITQADGRAA